MATKRIKNGVWEYIVKRSKLLDKPYYKTYPLDQEEIGDREIAQLEALLDAGIVPLALREEATQYHTIGDVIRDYLLKVSVGASDRPLLAVINARVGAAKLSKVDYHWVEQWITEMKVTLNLKPGTIRHHVGALGRCFDWAGRKNIVPLVINPIRSLPKGYSQYNHNDTLSANAYSDDHGAQEDDSRDRRMEDEEEVRIRAIMNRAKPEGRERPLTLNYQAAIELMFNLALETAMRMREMFTLTLDQVKIQDKTIFLERTKNGHKRQVPLSSVAIASLEKYMDQVNGGEGDMNGFAFDDNKLLPWWDGSLEVRKLAKTTALLSRQYARIFDAAGCPDLRFHDLRHEATSRFFERTQLSDFEIMTITGHSSTRMLKRYSNLRGSKLAAKLW